MKHTYIYQGRNYISSKRASEISDYSSDYIGQLCRAGKLDCQRVGHSWFVTEGSLRSHMTDVWSQDTLRSRASNLQKRFVKSQAMKSADVPLNDSKKRISSKQAALLSGYAADYIGQLCRGGKLDAVMIGKTWFVVEESLKGHMEKIRAEEEAKRISKIEKRNEKIVEKKESEQLSLENIAKKSNDVMIGRLAASLNVLDIRKNTAESLTSKLSMRTVADDFIKRSLLTRAMIVSAFVMLVGVGIYVAMEIPNEHAVDPGQQVAASIVPYPDIPYSVENSAETVPASRGIAVIPTSGSKAKDEEMKAAIKESFSDQVTVTPDARGESGVITPVFKNGKGNDFIYVMVPVDNSQNSNQHPP